MKTYILSTVCALVGAFLVTPATASAGKTACEYFDHLGSKGADCGTWICFDTGDGWSCNAKNGSGSDWSTDCPECTGSKPEGRSDCVEVFDADGRSAADCSGEPSQLLRAAERAGVRLDDFGGLTWCDSSGCFEPERSDLDLDLDLGGDAPTEFQCSGKMGGSNGYCAMSCGGLTCACMDFAWSWSCTCASFSAGGGSGGGYQKTTGWGSVCG